jgi:hypothetical protein
MLRQCAFYADLCICIQQAIPKFGGWGSLQILQVCFETVLRDLRKDGIVKPDGNQFVTEPLFRGHLLASLGDPFMDAWFILSLGDQQHTDEGVKHWLNHNKGVFYFRFFQI